MATQTIEPARIVPMNEKDADSHGDYVLYWMQQSQRAAFNHALEYAVGRANSLDVPLVVGFGLMADYPEANLRSYHFLAQGLQEVEGALAHRGIRFVLQYASPDEAGLDLGRRACVIVTDRGYLRHQKQWRRRVAKQAKVELVQVETDVVVPVEQVSDKAEYAARTIRPRINRQREDYLVPLKPTAVDHGSLDLPIHGEPLDDLNALLQPLDLDQTVQPVAMFTGGQCEGRNVFGRFLEQRLGQYTAHRNQPQTSDTSYMSMYLHFGQISPVWLGLEVRNSDFGTEEDREAYLEEMIVRRELTMNFCEFEPRYDRYACLPHWAQATMKDHRDDPREHQYTRQQLEDAQTHDLYWNAAMREMRYTGYMHNYMRMYWGKKILEWTNTPEYAYQTTLYLNNKYFLDGRDPNSFANVGWVFGLHDRPWTERAVFGKIRYMNANGLKRKCDPDAYVEKIDRLVEG